jgi:hypothetical protein
MKKPTVVKWKISPELTWNTRNLMMQNLVFNPVENELNLTSIIGYLEKNKISR